MREDKNFQNEAAMNDGETALTIISWLFGTIVLAIGFVNTFWGNDVGFGVFILLLSLLYFIAIKGLVKRMTGFTLPNMRLLKILLGIFILWAALGVGELFDKINLMMN